MGNLFNKRHCEAYDRPDYDMTIKKMPNTVRNIKDKV